MLVTTHYIEEVEGCDRVCIIDHGRILAIDTPDALKRAHGQQSCCASSRARTATASEILAAYPDRPPAQTARSSSDPAGDGFVEASSPQLRQPHSPPCGRGAEPGERCSSSLTGREIRDQAAGARERTLAFGRQGGEHTR